MSETLNDTVRDRVVAILAEQALLDPAQVRMDATLKDLGIDSLGLVEAIRKMTSFPAQRLGLPDRGLLRDGFKADVVVFDAQTVKAPATRREPKQFPIGIEHVIVNGRIVVERGQHTGVLAGRALRRGRPST